MPLESLENYLGLEIPKDWGNCRITGKHILQINPEWFSMNGCFVVRPGNVIEIDLDEAKREEINQGLETIWKNWGDGLEIEFL